MEELKKCPFCGSKAVIRGCSAFWAYCEECKMETKLYNSKKEVIDAWNRRVEK